MSSENATPLHQRALRAVQLYCSQPPVNLACSQPSVDPAMQAFDIAEEWFDVNLEVDGTSRIRPAFAPTAADRCTSPVASEVRRPLQEVPVNNNVATSKSPSSSPAAKKAKTKAVWTRIAERVAFASFKEHRTFVEGTGIRMRRITQSENSRTYGCNTHATHEGVACPYAEKYVYSAQTRLWEVFHNGFPHAECVTAGPETGVPVRFRATLTELAAARRGQPAVALNDLLQKHWDGTEKSKQELPTLKQVQNFVGRLKEPTCEIDTVAGLSAWVVKHSMPSERSEFDAWASGRDRCEAFVVSYERYIRCDRYGPAIAMTNLILGENIQREHSSHEDHNIFTVKGDASFGKQQGEYILIDLGTDGVTFEKPHLWKVITDKRNCPHQSFYLFLYVIAKSESIFSYLVGLRALIKYAKVAFGIDLPISIVCGDNMRALTAAANQIDKPGGLDMVLSIRDVEHVRRKYLEKALIINDRHLLEDAFTLEMRKLIADIAKREWEGLGLQAFVNAIRNFTHGEHIMFFRGASTIPGIAATMQSDERGHKEDHRLADRHATHLVVLEKTVPVLLRNRAFKNRDTFAHSLPTYPTVFLKLACELMSVESEDDPCNFYLYPSRIHGFDFIYMNLNATGKAVTELRVSKFRLLIRGENPRNFFHSLDLVRKYSDDIVELTFNVDDPTDPVNGDACSCKWFWYCKCCPHILAAYHLRDCLDIFGMMERAFPHNKPKTMCQKRAAEACK
ncbi:hypothetical protein CYMTET_9342 [Cymbomonas tetramitiformis]|uniref:SWIM-type domain-containing protein n=1 Tax=Cymbomonas tetramitiformis TaxID=36881 RepID=A0AAE0LFJ7_9CHLO|nr:hypothetical protein CYMTET_9342 [Cymbomonas tetramitiformis]